MAAKWIQEGPPFGEKHVFIRSVVIITCSFAMLGSVAVILSYICIKSIRHQARQIIINLSLMDFGIGASNLVGAAVNFDQFYNTSHSIETITDDLCKAQAFIALMTTISSVCWTMSLAIYMYLLIFQNWFKMRWFMPVCYAISYGLPALVTVWMLLTKRLGHAPYDTSGWCGIIITNPFDLKIDYIACILGYDMWIYLAFIVCLVIYLAIFLRMNVEYKNAIQLVGAKRFWLKALEFLDIKLLLIPVAFFILRIWSCILSIMFDYCQLNPKKVPDELSSFLIVMSGIGDSGQGLVNGMIFVLFTGNVRRTVISNPLKKIKDFCVKRQCINKPAEEHSLISSDTMGEANRKQRSPRSPSDIITPTSSLMC
jgi:G protein-coupled receptor 157